MILVFFFVLQSCAVVLTDVDGDGVFVVEVFVLGGKVPIALEELAPLRCR